MYKLTMIVIRAVAPTPAGLVMARPVFVSLGFVHAQYAYLLYTASSTSIVIQTHYWLVLSVSIGYNISHLHARGGFCTCCISDG